MEETTVATNPAEETVTATTPAEETVTATTAPAEEFVTTMSPEATAGAEGSIEKDTGVSEEGDTVILTVGASEEGENVLLFAQDTAAETEAVTEAPASLSFQPMNFVYNLKYMGIGMVTIFIVIGVIILATAAINKIFSKKK